MGAWGPGIYENDDAADWGAEVTDLGLQAVEDALDIAIEADYIEAPDGACALAAADVVARLVSGRGENSVDCEDVVAWVEANAVCPAGVAGRQGQDRGGTREERRLGVGRPLVRGCRNAGGLVCLRR